MEVHGKKVLKHLSDHVLLSMTVEDFILFSKFIDAEKLYEMHLEARKNDEIILIFTENTRKL